jgi:hypothetical protein
MLTPETPAGQYKVKTGETETNTDVESYYTTFDYLIKGAARDPIAANSFKAGKYYRLLTDPQVNGAESNTHDLFAIAANALLATYIADDIVLRAYFDSGGLNMVPNLATAHEVFLHSAGEEFTLHADFTASPATALQNSAFTKEAYAVSSVDYNNCEYTITVPNETSFPGKTRCLCQVQSLFHKTYGDTVAYV